MSTLVSALFVGLCIFMILELCWLHWERGRLRREERERDELRHLLGARRWWKEEEDGHTEI